MQDFIVTKDFLDENPNVIFVYGDNLLHKGTGGAAVLRYHPQSYGFVTKRYPNNYDSSFFKPDEYQDVFNIEVNKLINHIVTNPNKMFFISRLGAGLANRYNIFDKIIQEQLKICLTPYLNRVVFLW